MDAVLIATKNNEKFETISSLIERVFPERFKYENVNDSGIDLDIIETGSVIERAQLKAIKYWEYLNKINQNKYFISIGIDDGFSLTKDGDGDPDSKKITDEILSGKLLQKRQAIWLKRGIVICNDKVQEAIITSIPFIFIGNPNNIKRVEGIYSLRNVLAPINQNIVQAQIKFNKLIEYYLFYCSDDIKYLFHKIL